MVGPGIAVLDGGLHAALLQGKGGFGRFTGVSPHLFEWRIVKQKYSRLVCKKLIVFPYGQYIVGMSFHWFSVDIVR